MKKISWAIDRFCQKHRRFGIPNLMMYIALGNAVVLIFDLMDTSGMLLSLLSFDPVAVLTRGQVWRLITFVLIPPFSSNLIFTALAIYFYYFIGSSLERQWGTAKFTLYYLSGMLLTVIYGVAVSFFVRFGVPMSAIYINLSMFFAFATLWPDMRFLVFYFIPVKVKWLALLDAIFFVYGIIRNPFPLNLLPIVAIFNYLFFCGDELWQAIRPYITRNQSGAVNFRRAAKKVRREQKNAPYTRKCEVCGRTDTDYPELGFRYCSRCGGYHCFCEDHINNHSHFTQ